MENSIINDKKYIPGIEYLRIICINMIVLYHLGCMIYGDTFTIKLFQYISLRLWMAVDVFFAISGFFFYHSFTQKKPIAFLKDRVIRIVPGYYLFLIIFLTIGIPIERSLGNMFAFPTKYYWIHFFTFTANIPMAFGTWSGVALEGFFGICMLIQFYIILSLLFSLIKVNKNRIVVLIILEILAITLRGLPFFKSSEWTSYFFTFTRIDSFIAGILLAMIRENPTINKLFTNHKMKVIIITFIPIILVLQLTNLFKLENPFTARYGFPFIALFIIGILNFIFSFNKKRSRFHSGAFVYSIFLIRLPAIYLIIGIFRHYGIFQGKTNTVPLFVSYIFLIIWGMVFQILKNHLPFIRKKLIKIYESI